MNKVSQSHRKLLVELLKYLKDSTVVNTYMDEYLASCIRGILNDNMYTNDEKFLLNGLRELYLKVINPSTDEMVNDIDDKFDIW